MRFVHISDVHIGAGIDIGSKWEKNADKEIQEGFISVIDYVEANNIDFLFITGDLFDNVPGTKELEFVDSQLARLVNTNIIYIAGQNDYLKQGAKIHKFRFVSNIYVAGLENYLNGATGEKKGIRSSSTEPVVDCIRFEEQKVEVYAISQKLPVNYENDTSFAYVHRRDYINILLAYGGSDNEVPFVPEELHTMGFDYVGLGHKHSYEAFSEGKVCYAGSLLPLCAKEVGEHGFIKGYVDKTICSTRFVPLKGRRYLDIHKTVCTTDTVAELEKYFEEIILKNKYAIYSIYLDREKDCITDFDFSNLKKKYRILKIEGEKPETVDVDKLIALNVGNAFGKNLRRISHTDSKMKEQALIIYSKAMHNKIWGDNNPNMDFERADDEQIESAHATLMEEYKRELSEIYKEIEKCESADLEIKEQLEQYPDRTGRINLLKPQIAAIKSEIEQTKYRDEQINKIYSLHRVKTILAFDAPIAVVFLIVSTVGVFDVFVMRIWDEWLNFLIALIILIILVSGTVFLLYNKTRIFTRKLFDGEDTATLHVKYNNEIARLEHELYEKEKLIAQYEADLVNHKKYEERAGKLKEKSAKIADRFNILMLIIGK